MKEVFLMIAGVCLPICGLLLAPSIESPVGGALVVVFGILAGAGVITCAFLNK